MFYPSGIFRMKARAALKGHWQTALLVALIVNLPTLLMQGFSAYTGNDLVSRLQAVMITASRDGLLTQDLLLKEFDAIMGSTSFWTVRGLEALAWLITPCLTLGMYKWLTDRLRGQEDPVSTVLCRMKLFLKAIGLQLLIILKILLWMLPGIGVAAGMMIPMFQAGDVESKVAALRQGYSMSLPVILLIAIPAAMAALRYAMAEFIMADEPGEKILSCIRLSKKLMTNHKRDLLFLLLSFLLWHVLEMLIASMLTGVLCQVFQMLAGLALSVYAGCSVAAFYLFLVSGETAVREPEPEELN